MPHLLGMEALMAVRTTTNWAPGHLGGPSQVTGWQTTSDGGGFGGFKQQPRASAAPSFSSMPSNRSSVYRPYGGASFVRTRGGNMDLRPLMGGFGMGGGGFTPMPQVSIGGGGAPGVDASPIWDENMINQQVNTTRANIDAGTERELQNAQRGMANRGFSTNQPWMKALMGGQGSAAGSAAEQAQRWDAAQKNKEHVLKAQLGAGGLAVQSQQNAVDAANAQMQYNLGQQRNQIAAQQNMFGLWGGLLGGAMGGGQTGVF